MNRTDQVRALVSTEGRMRVLPALALLLVACSEEPSRLPPGQTDAGMIESLVDAGPPDLGPLIPGDADAGAPMADAGALDAGAFDAGPPPDFLGPPCFRPQPVGCAYPGGLRVLQQNLPIPLEATDLAYVEATQTIILIQDGVMFTATEDPLQSDLRFVSDRERGETRIWTSVAANRNRALLTYEGGAVLFNPADGRLTEVNVGNRRVEALNSGGLLRLGARAEYGEFLSDGLQWTAVPEIWEEDGPSERDRITAVYGNPYVFAGAYHGGLTGPFGARETMPNPLELDPEFVGWPLGHGLEHMFWRGSEGSLWERCEQGFEQRTASNSMPRGSETLDKIVVFERGILAYLARDRVNFSCDGARSSSSLGSFPQNQHGLAPFTDGLLTVDEFQLTRIYVNVEPD